MVSRASVTRELGSPAALPDLNPRSRRSSSRASQRTQPLELNTSNLTQSSYSLPPTPLASSFDEVLPSAKRRRTQRALNSEDKTLPLRAVTETPTHRACSEPFQTPNSQRVSARPTRASNLVHSDTQSPRPIDTSKEANPGIPSSPKSNPPTSTSEQPPTDQQTTTPKKPPLRHKTVTVKDETEKDNPAETPATMGAAMSQAHGRTTRKSMPTRLDSLASQQNGVTPAKSTALPASTPQSSRRDRKSRLAANTGAKISKPSPASKTQSALTASSTKAKTPSGVSDATPAKRPLIEVLKGSTRSRRRDRNPTRATNEETQPSNKSSVPIVSPTRMYREPHSEALLETDHSQSPNKRSNTVTLNVGRKLIDILKESQTRENEAANSIDAPGHTENGDYHFDYDSEMYKNNFGLDGHMEPPTSPTSLSTTTSNAARTSGRARKPTIRALESFESEQQYRRPRAPSIKPPSTDEVAGKTRSKQKSPQESPNSASKSAHKPDVVIIATQIYELAAAAVAPDFVSPPEVHAWIKELQQKVDQRAKEKEAGVTQSVEEADGEEETQDSNKPFLDNVQVSEPWTDGDGWEHTGQNNKHDEEFVIVPSNYEYYRPNNTYGDDELPLPPVRLRSLVQAEKDRAFGYPPRIGDRNLPADNQGFFLFENVPEEKLKLKIREDARAKGIYVHRFMSFEELEKLIDLFEKGQPAVLPVLDTSLAQAKPSRKRRRAEPSRLSISYDDADTQRPKRRRQETNNVPAEPIQPEPSAEEPPSPEQKSLRIKLTFENKQLFLEQVMANEANTATESKNWPHSEIEEPAPEKAHGHDTRLPKTQKSSAATEHNTTQSASGPVPPSTPANAADKTEKPNTTQATPASADNNSNETTPGGRPRRRAADALMAGFQRHAEDRARRAERARLGHARRKGTPLKTVTGVHGDTVESPIRPAVNPMNLD
ncbi:hypothetical protein BDV12DRAFT_121538 [Aspergillus spectabilis]